MDWIVIPLIFIILSYYWKQCEGYKSDPTPLESTKLIKIVKSFQVLKMIMWHHVVSS